MSNKDKIRILKERLMEIPGAKIVPAALFNHFCRKAFKGYRDAQTGGDPALLIADAALFEQKMSINNRRHVSGFISHYTGQLAKDMGFYPNRSMADSLEVIGGAVDFRLANPGDDPDKSLLGMAMVLANVSSYVGDYYKPQIDLQMNIMAKILRAFEFNAIGANARLMGTCMASIAAPLALFAYDKEYPRSETAMIVLGELYTAYQRGNLIIETPLHKDLMRRFPSLFAVSIKPKIAKAERPWGH